MTLRLLRAGGFIVALAFRCLPVPLRFRAAFVAARCLEFFIERTRVYETRKILLHDNLRETAVDLVLDHLTRHGTEFDPILEVHGAESLSSMGHGPALVIGVHTMLSMLFVRYVYDKGLDLRIITAVPLYRVPGTRKPARVLIPSPALLFDVRRGFKNGETLGAMIDRLNPDRRSSQFQSAAGSLTLSNTLIRLAVRHHAHIIFIATKLDERSHVVMRLGRPRSSSVAADDVISDFAQFVDETWMIDPDRLSATDGL